MAPLRTLPLRRADTDVDPDDLGTTPLHHRRTSILSYQNPGARDYHDDRTYARGPRNLVVVIPPPDFTLHHGHLGNVLSMGPRHRLSHGILMPLFPSMFAQLNAIAREYNFPSTVGLCLYLHINENGSLMTPRISDDSWQYLFGHLFEARPPTGHQLPIGGSIEFDIDLNKARWYDTWVSGTLRDSDPFPSVVPSHPSLGAHWQGDLNVDDHPVDDQWDTSGSQTLVNNSRQGTLRHVPKKLSLVDKLESHLSVPPKSQHHPDHPDSSQTHRSDALSPASQSGIPQVAKSDLERLVNSWRATTELYPNSMTEAYQPAPDVAVSLGMTIMDDYALVNNFSKQAENVDEYLWSSFKSAGPPNPVMKSPMVPFAKETVPHTPTVVTSRAPTDDKWHSTVSTASLLPSPDMGERVTEDIIAPRSCAIWGNSFGWRSATTWKAVYPYSATHTMPTIQVELRDSKGLVSQYPNLVIYPAVCSQSTARSVWRSSFGWQRAATWQKVYPYSITTMQQVAPIQLCGAGGLASKYPNIYIYPVTYPNFEIYPACIVKEDVSRPVSVTLSNSSNLTLRYPTLVIYPTVYPHFDIYPPVAEGLNTKGSDLLDTSTQFLHSAPIVYPSLVIYPSVYPHFDLYPKAAILQINEMPEENEADVKPANAGRLETEYPNMTIYPSAYPYLDIYPIQYTYRKTHTSSVAWGISFGWLTAKTWLQVYPLHTAIPSTRERAADDPGKFTLQRSETADIVPGKQATWGSSFGWKSTTTWRAVWPTAYARVHSDMQSGSVSNYPHLTIYPAAYPNFDIYPPRAAIAEVNDALETEIDQCTVNLVPCYPNLVIYPAAYPHIDVYPPFARTLNTSTGHSNLRLRRIEMWRAKTAAQVCLVDLLANNHIWEAEEPLQIDLAAYAWSQTSAGPSTSPAEFPHTPSASGSIHIDRRMQGSVLLTPSTATTWGPQDDDWCSDIASIDRLPSPDIGQRVLDDVENIEFPHRPWHLVWPFFGNTSAQVKNLPSVPEKSVFAPEYPHLVIYPPAYPYFELYPAWANVPALTNQVTERFANLNRYAVFDIYPAVYPHFDIYPAVDSPIEVPSRTASEVWNELVEVRLPSLYPNFDIYRACYPYNLDYIYPFIHAIESTPIKVTLSSGFPWLVVYPPVYPFIIPYPGFSAELKESLSQPPPPSLSPPEMESITIKLTARYPTLDIYSAGYPWSLESIYPAVSVGGFSEVLGPHYPFFQIYATVYPFVQPYPDLPGLIHIPRASDEDEKELTKTSEFEHPNSESVVYPYFCLYPAASASAPRQEQDAYVDAPITPIKRRHRMTHSELHALVFRCLEKQPARNSKTHLQLHNEVFQDGIVWTPSGYTEDLSSMATRKHAVVVREPQRRPQQDNPRQRHSPPGTTALQSPDKVVFPLVQPPALPPLRVRSPGIPSQPSPAVSESPMPRVSSPTNAFTHRRSTSSRLSQAVKAMLPGGQRRSSNASHVSPPPERKEHSVRDQQSPTRFLPLLDLRQPVVPSLHSSASPPPEDRMEQSPTRFLPLVDRRQPVVTPIPHTSASEFLTRAPQNYSRKESLVLQRARSYEQSIAVNQASSTSGTKGPQTPFLLPPLPPMPPMMDVVETIEKSKVTLP